MAAKWKKANMIPAKISPDGQKLTALEAELIEGEIELAESSTSLCSLAYRFALAADALGNKEGLIFWNPNR